MTTNLCSAGLRQATPLTAARRSFYLRFRSIVTQCAPGEDSRWNSRKSTKWTQSHEQIRKRSFSISPQCCARRPPPKRKPSGHTAIPVLPAKDLNTIFNREIDPTLGNRIIRTLQQRRVDGSLLEFGTTIDGADIPLESMMRALKWLRNRYPVDEQAAATIWADSEALKLSQGYISRAEKLGLVKSLSPKDRRTIEDYPSGPQHSVIDQMREINQKREREEKRKRIISGEAQRSEDMRLAKVEEQRSQSEQRQQALAILREKQYAAGMVSQDETPPDIPIFKRLGPSTLLALFMIGGFTYFAVSYEPPIFEDRLLQSLPPAWATMTVIGAIAGTTTFLWHVPRMWLTFNKYLVSVPANPYAISILGNVFSHRTVVHLATNMTFLFLYGPSLHDMVGRGNFIAIYCLGGVIGSVTSLYWYALRGILNTFSTGASGAVFSVVGAWAVLTFDRDTTQDSDRQFALDVLRYSLILGQIGAHFFGGIAVHVDIAAHIGGALTGLVGAYMLRWRAREQRQSDGQAPAAATGEGVS